MATRKKKLKKAEVLDLIFTLQASGNITVEMLLNFAEQINGGQFAEPSASKPKAVTLAKMKKEVLAKFGCKTVTELRKNRTFELAFTGEKVSLRSTEDWRIQYRKWVAVPEDERDQSGETCINGIDVLENFRPWHIFGLDSATATESDVKSAFRDLAKKHHPDVGGDARVFERLQKMRDSLLALMN